MMQLDASVYVASIARRWWGGGHDEARGIIRASLRETQQSQYSNRHRPLVNRTRHQRQPQRRPPPPLARRHPLPAPPELPPLLLGSAHFRDRELDPERGAIMARLPAHGL